MNLNVHVYLSSSTLFPIYKKDKKLEFEKVCLVICGCFLVVCVCLLVVFSGLWLFADGLWSFAGGLWLFAGGLWLFASCLWLLLVLVTTLYDSIQAMEHVS